MTQVRQWLENAGGRWRSWILLTIPVAFVTVLGWTHRQLTDDGFIYLRIVDQITQGNGPVFNAGERVEAYTSPAWTALLAVAEMATPFQLERIAVGLGLALSVIGVIAAMAGAVRLTGGNDERSDALMVPAGALVMAAPFAMWIWFTTGLETGLVFAWLGSCLFLLARWADRGRGPGVGVCVVLGLGWVIRPEAVLFSALFVLTVLIGDWAHSGWRRRARVVGSALAIPVLYQIFRMGYFGLMTPNTAVAKEGSSLVWDRGVDYLRDFVGPYWMWVPVLIVLVAGYVPLALKATSRQRLVVGAFLLGGCISALYVVAIGGDYFHGRMFVPALFALCAPVAAVPLSRRFVGLALLVPWAAVAAASLRPAIGFVESGTYVPASFGKVTLNDYGWVDGTPLRTWFQGEDLYVERDPFTAARSTPATFAVAVDQSTPAVSASAIGAIGYALGPDVYIVDTLGLADPIGSHFETAPGRPMIAGHEKPHPAAWMAAKVAAPGQQVEPGDLGLLGGGQVPLIPALNGDAFTAQVTDVRGILECAPLRRVDEAANAHLGLRLFVRNLVEAPASTRLRIPPDPAEARARFCE